MKKTCNSLEFNEICIMSFEKNETMIIEEKRKPIDTKILVLFLLLIKYDKFIFLLNLDVKLNIFKNSRLA